MKMNVCVCKCRHRSMVFATACHYGPHYGPRYNSPLRHYDPHHGSLWLFSPELASRADKTALNGRARAVRRMYRKSGIEGFPLFTLDKLTSCHRCRRFQLHTRTRAPRTRTLCVSRVRMLQDVLVDEKPESVEGLDSLQHSSCLQ